MADITATNTLTARCASDAEALAQTSMTPAPSDAKARPAAGPRDTAETATDDGVPTRDGGTWIGRLTAKAAHGVAVGAGKAWEHTASAQRRVNEQASKSREHRGAPARDERDAHADHGMAEKGYHAMHTLAHLAHVGNEAQSVVRNYRSIRGASSIKEAIDIVHHGQIGHGQVGGAVMKSVGTSFFVFDAGINSLKVLHDITDEDGLSIDSLQPIADTTASAIGTFGGPVGTAFHLGYEGGKMLDKTVGIGEAIDRAHDRSIKQRSQICFLEDRAREMDIAVAMRIWGGMHDRADAKHVRDILREAREHGLLNANGEVDRGRLWSMVSSGSWGDTQRIANGIERAAELEQHITAQPGRVPS